MIGDSFFCFDEKYKGRKFIASTNTSISIWPMIRGVEVPNNIEDLIIVSLSKIEFGIPVILVEKKLNFNTFIPTS